MILSALRKAMAKANINIYILPRTDEYQSEYLTKDDERVQYLTKFTGSNALAMVSRKQSLLWTDSRYYIQAKNQLEKDWKMMKMEKGQKRWWEHVIGDYGKDQVIGIDGRLVTFQNGKQRLKYFEEKGYKLELMRNNLIDQIWTNRPTPQYQQIFVHQQYAGTPASQKIKHIQGIMTQKKANACIITDLSEICWILNVRSSQIPFNPFMKSILVIQNTKSILYLPKCHPSLMKPSQQLVKHFANIQTNFASFPVNFTNLPQNILAKDTNYNIYKQLKNPIQWQGIGLQRAKRTPKQREGFRNCHIRDGVAMSHFWSKRSKMETIGEYQAAEMLQKERRKQNLNKGLSFQTISAGGPNGAIVHYRPNLVNDFIVTNNMIHLVDSGGQYLDGTTDVTRAFHFGTPTQQEKNAYTRVLLGNLDIQRLRWPRNFGIKGSHIDVLARRRLWQQGLNYGHGTGHGVGYFEGVHQSPVGISHLNNTVLQQGMVTSNQPGYYKTNYFGIRIQNLLLVITDKKDNQYLTFQNLTLCPYDINLIDASLLTNNDISFINAYHQRCWDTLSPLINDKSCLQWLSKSTRKIQTNINK